MAGTPETNAAVNTADRAAFTLERRKFGDIEVLFDPSQRLQWIDAQLNIAGLPSVQEDARAAYCPVSLTSVPDELKPFLRNRQKLLMDEALKPVEITAYDPTNAPCSPYVDLAVEPSLVYREDSTKIASSRFFVGHNILPSSGFGVETVNATQLMRIPVLLMDAHIRVSTMMPSRVIYLQYEDFSRQVPEFISVFKLLQQFEPGIGFHHGIPRLLGFRTDGAIVDLEETVYETFPDLQYFNDARAPIVEFQARNPHIFSEYTSTI